METIKIIKIGTEIKIGNLDPKEQFNAKIIAMLIEGVNNDKISYKVEYYNDKKRITDWIMDYQIRDNYTFTKLGLI